MPLPRMDYQSYIYGAYALAVLLIGGLILLSWWEGKRTNAALSRQDERA